MKSSFRLMLLAFVVGLLSIANAFGNNGKTGEVSDECQSRNPNLKKLCNISTAVFKRPAGSYVSIGGEFYLVIISGLAHVQNGIYVANVKSERINQFGGYAEAELVRVTKAPNGSIWIRVKRFDMSHGQVYEGETLLERRVNPITRTPFLIEHPIWANSFSEECSEPENRKSPECSGKAVYLDEKDIERLQYKSVSMDQDQVRRILEAHRKALRVDNARKFEAYGLLEKAGIQSILDAKPAHMTTGQYVNILNDYAFWAYQYGEGRMDLAIEILYKVIQLSPDRATAYLNMADALEYLARFGATEYASTPLDDETIVMLKKTAKLYQEKYDGMAKKYVK